MKHLFIISTFLILAFTSKGQNINYIYNNSSCPVNIYFTRTNPMCIILNQSNTITVNPGTSGSFNLYSLTWTPALPFIYVPSFSVSVFYPNSLGVPCSGTLTLSISDNCNPTSGTLIQCHPTCPNINVLYDSVTNTLVFN